MQLGNTGSLVENLNLSVLITIEKLDAFSADICAYLCCFFGGTLGCHLLSASLPSRSSFLQNRMKEFDVNSYLLTSIWEI